MDAWDDGEMDEQSDRQIGGWMPGCLDGPWVGRWVEWPEKELREDQDVCVAIHAGPAPPHTFPLEGGTWHPHPKPHSIPFVRDCCSHLGLPVPTWGSPRGTFSFS